MANRSRPGRKQPQKQPQRRNHARPSTQPARAPHPIPEVVVPTAFEPAVGSTYPQLLRNPGFTVGRSAIGIVLAVLGWLILYTFVNLIVIAIGWLVVGRGTDYQVFVTAAGKFENPVGMLGANLGLASCILVGIALTVIIHRSRPGLLASVAGRIRWRYLLGCLVPAALVFGTVVGIGLVSGDVALKPQPQVVAFVIIIVLTSPLQAAGEEVLFRGYLMQAIGSLVRSPWIGVVLSSVLFAALHGTQNVALVASRFAFGLLMAVLVMLTGGLEASIAAHAVNNVLAFGVPALTSSVAAARSVQSIGWVESAQQIAAYVVFAGLAIALHRLLKLTTVVPPGTVEQR